jgi:hypothetical protein
LKIQKLTPEFFHIPKLKFVSGESENIENIKEQSSTTDSKKINSQIISVKKPKGKDEEIPNVKKRDYKYFSKID